MLQWRKSIGGKYSGIKDADIYLCAITQKASTLTIPTITDAVEIGDKIDISWNNDIILFGIISTLYFDYKANTTTINCRSLWNYNLISAPFNYGQFRNISLSAIINNMLLPEIGCKVADAYFQKIVSSYYLSATFQNEQQISRLSDFGVIPYSRDGKNIEDFLPSVKATATFKLGSNILTLDDNRSMMAIPNNVALSSENQVGINQHKNSIIKRYLTLFDSNNLGLAAKTYAKALRLIQMNDYVKIEADINNQPIAFVGDKIVIEAMTPFNNGEYVVRESKFSFGRNKANTISYQAVPAEAVL